jgi:serine/threonine protein kinase
VAVKIILKKNVKGNEQMVVDELRMLREMKHPHIVQFVDWFESRVSNLHLSFANHWLNQFEFRINIILLHNWPQVENSSIAFANKDDLQKKMPHKQSDKSLKLWITYTERMLCTEVGLQVIIIDLR